MIPILTHPFALLAAAAIPVLVGIYFLLNIRTVAIAIAIIMATMPTMRYVAKSLLLTGSAAVVEGACVGDEVD